ncbi:hydroxyethylthiazole kinase [Oceanobacillus halophilus]|uniref:Hydroxyethylthiazole kinase n=1 Tax=Oceanobacillus halophilus TaxID=930130 RepID=A0A495A2T7_9BACI|nr:hydroxyethylthiazole kinase [Oceanobacillus halophilus]RKQ33246.1 hydroxyethylthiazole kinase [Oceanobacillus halophilus]
MNKQIIEKVRENTPLIHHLTNQVVMNFTANGLLSFGAAPVMAKAEEEAADMASTADGVLLNIGTLTPNELKAMISAGKAANQKDIPVVLDPVGVAATSFRADAVKQLLNKVRPTVIKGNAGELAHLIDIPWKTKGVDSVGDGNIEEITRQVARTYQTTAILTGKTDVICTSETTIVNKTGHPILAKVTGAGCLLGSLLAACLTTDDSIEEQALTAVQFYGLAAEYAASYEDVQASGTFIPHFIDALSLDAEFLKGAIV